MKFKWMTVAAHQAAMKANEDKIASLEAQIAGNEGGSEQSKKLSALFGADADEEGFDLHAKMKSTLDYLAGIEQDLEDREAEITAQTTKLDAATAQLDTIAKHLGEEKYTGQDLAAKVGEIEPEVRKSPLQKETDELKSTDNAGIRCSIDDELDALLKDAGIGED